MHNPTLRARHDRQRTAIPIAQSIAVLLLSFGASAHAETGRQFLLTAYLNSPGGAQLAAGQYATALASIAGKAQTTPSGDGARQTNACVAYVALKQLRKARQACDAAVLAADRFKGHATGVVSTSRRAEDEQAAIAYTNRAIAHCLSNEVVSCAEDLAQAHALLPDGGFVVRNLAAFQQRRGEMPAVEVAARRIGECEVCAADARSVELICAYGVRECR